MVLSPSAVSRNCLYRCTMCLVYLAAAVLCPCVSLDHVRLQCRPFIPGRGHIHSAVASSLTYRPCSPTCLLRREVDSRCADGFDARHRGSYTHFPKCQSQRAGWVPLRVQTASCPVECRAGQTARPRRRRILLRREPRTSGACSPVLSAWARPEDGRATDPRETIVVHEQSGGLFCSGHKGSLGAPHLTLYNFAWNVVLWEQVAKQVDGEWC